MVHQVTVLQISNDVLVQVPAVWIDEGGQQGCQAGRGKTQSGVLL